MSSIYYSIFNPKFKIKDKIHDYIDITEIESALIETELVQRLRNISQSGFIHSVYPSNRISRFEHSLGCMHLCGLFIENMFYNSGVNNSSINNNNKSIYELFIENFINSYKKVIPSSNDELSDYINYLLFNSNIIKESKFSTNFLIESVIWQSLRIVGLLHDIGHLPFSHSIEPIITKNINLLNLTNDEKLNYLRYYNNSYHEFATVKLLNTDSIKNCFVNHTPIYNIITQIFLSKINSKKNNKFVNNKESFTIFDTLLEIVDSEVDADRCDYLKRDGSCSGSHMGNYDLTRLIQNTHLLIDKNNSFYIRPSHYASSNVEEFLIERYRIYKDIHFHHKSVLLNTLVYRIVNYLINPDIYDINLKIHLKGERLNYLQYIFNDPQNNLYNCPFDDIYLISLFREVYGELFYKSKSSLISENEEYLMIFLQILLYRTKNYISLWKRNEDYFEIYNNKIKPALESNLNDAEISLNKISNNYLKDFLTTEELESIINKHIDKSKIDCRIIMTPKTFKIFKNDYFIINTKHKIYKKLYINEFAPLLYNSKNLIDNTVQIFCWAILKNSQIKAKKYKPIPLLTDSLIKGIIEWFKSLTLF